MPPSSSPVRVLLVNDDGPPGPDSPHVFGLYKHLVNDLGWVVKVVLPISQKSWIGNSYHMTEVIRGKYFYPTEPDGVQGETSPIPRDLKDGEVAEWILLDGTPATCTNIGLHNLYPGQIDLVLSGPNFGRNTSAAYSLVSGTVGAAMSGALCRTRAIAVSYGMVKPHTPTEWNQHAHGLFIRIVKHLWENWGKDPDGARNQEVDLYSVNIPLIPRLATATGLETYRAPMWCSSLCRLLEVIPDGDQDSERVSGTAGSLAFKWAPDLRSLITPDLSALPVGSDSWAFGMGHATVTPLKACFAEAESGEIGNPEGKPGLLKV
ncbi:sure-like protein [Scleroderma citrinum]